MTQVCRTGNMRNEKSGFKRYTGIPCLQYFMSSDWFFQ